MSNTWVPRVGYRYWFLAREIGADYGDVLSFVDLVEKPGQWRNDRGTWNVAPNYWQQQALEHLSTLQKTMIIDEMRTEYQRREELLASSA